MEALDIKNKANIKGFTLVELSIALVIVGLLIGGILVGQSLVRSAKLIQIISGVNQYKILVAQGQAKFRCLAGDCPSAIVGSYAGDNDKIIEAYLEQQRGLVQLQTMGLYQGTEDLSACPTNWPDSAAISCFWRGSDKKSKNIFMVRNFLSSTGGEFNYGPSGINTIEVGSNWIVYGRYLNDHCCSVTRPGGALMPEEAAALDSKLDDGIPTTGDVRTFPGRSISTSDCLSLNSLVDPANTYAITKTNPTCSPYFYMQIGGNVKL